MGKKMKNGLISAKFVNQMQPLEKKKKKKKKKYLIYLFFFKKEANQRKA